jgi:hypothetical protein
VPAWARCSCCGGRGEPVAETAWPSEQVVLVKLEIYRTS